MILLLRITRFTVIIAGDMTIIKKYTNLASILLHESARYKLKRMLLGQMLFVFFLLL